MTDRTDRNDAEGDALAAEIAADRRSDRDRRRRLLLYVPPLASLVVAALAIAASHPRTVLGARVVVGAHPPADTSLDVRLVVVRATPGDVGVELASSTEVRIARTAATTDEDGVADLALPAPIAGSFVVEGRDDKDWKTIATFDASMLPALDPSDGVTPLQRTTGTARGELLVDVAPEFGAIVPPFNGAAWVRVRRTAGDPVVGARVTTTAEAGIARDVADVTTNGDGLARIVVVPSAPPIIVTVTAETAGVRGTWSGVLGAVLGVPAPTSARIDPASDVVAIVTPSPLSHAYVDLFRDGVRLGGARVSFVAGAEGRAAFRLPKEAIDRGGLYDLAISTSAEPPSGDDLSHAATWPIVVARDFVDAWAALVPPRIPEKITPRGGQGPGAYEAAFAASIARAPLALPPRRVVADGLPAALSRESSRAKAVRRSAVFAILGGALVELALMLALGVFKRRRAVDEEIRALAAGDELRAAADDAHAAHEGHGVGGRVRVAAFVLGALGGITLVFAALALMVWGLPG